MSQEDLEEFKAQAKFKSFATDFSAQLLLFDKAKEWADLIKCLQRITRVLIKYNMYPVVPDKLLFAKRLGQCCNPVLPPGVHLKTLETYEIVFERIGTERLAKDLPFWSSGLFPLFAYASMQVKPKFIELIEKFYLPLKKELLPCLSGLVMCLVSGLEEQNSETYPRVIKLLDKLCDATDKSAIFHAMWKSLSLNPSTRIGAVHYLQERLPKTKSPEEVDMYLPNRSTLVLNAMIKAMQDQQVLVQRALLDLLLTHFRLEHQLFDTEGVTRLIYCALSVVLRREVSLSRRVYSWLLGETGEAGQEQPQQKDYYDRFSRQPMIAAISEVFQGLGKDNESASVPFKVLQQLFDKPEVSAPIIYDILPFVLDALHRFKEGFPFSSEVVAQVNVVLDGLKPEVVWNFVNEFVMKDMKICTPVSPLHSVAMVDSLTEKMLELNSPDSQSKYLPSLVRTLVSACKITAERSNLSGLLATLALTLKIVGKIHPSITPVATNHDLQQKHDHAVSATPQPISEAIDVFLEFYPHLITTTLKKLWELEATTVEDARSKDQQSKLRIRARADPASFWVASVSINIFDIASQVLVAFYSHFKIKAHANLGGSESGKPTQRVLPGQSWVLPKWFSDIIDALQTPHPLAACLAIRTFISVMTLPPNGDITPQLQLGVIMDTKHCHRVAKKLWDLLHPSLSIVHYRAAQLFLELKDLSVDICEDVISEAYITGTLDQRVSGLQRFALLWRLTGELGTNISPFNRNLFQMLDSLNDDHPMVKLAGRTWLADSISKVERILDPLLVVLLDKSTIRVNNVYQSEYDCRRVLYVFRILESIIECDFRSFMLNVVERPISKEVAALNDKHVIIMDARSADEFFQFSKPKNYLDLLVLIALRFMSGQTTLRSNADFVSKNGTVQTTATSFLQYLLQKITVPSKASELAKVIQEPVLQNLAQAVSTSNQILQAKLLSLLRTIVLLDHSQHRPGGTGSTGDFSTLTSVGGSSGSPMSAIATGVVGQERETATDVIGQSQMLVQTIITGLLQPNTDFNIRFYWLEFVTSCIPFLHKYLKSIVPPVVECLCDIINRQESVYDSVGSKDMLMLLKAMNFLIKYVVTGQDVDRRARDATVTNKSDTNAFSSFFKTIFLQADLLEEVPPPTPTQETTTALLTKLPVIIESLIKIWGSPTTTMSKANKGVPKGLGLAVEFSKDETHNRYALQDLVLQMIEPLYLHFPTRFLVALLHLWKFIAPGVDPSPEDVQIKMTLIDILNTMTTANSETIFKSLVDVIRWLHQDDIRKQNQRGPHQRRRSVIGPSIHNMDSVVLDFALSICEWGTKQMTDNSWTFLANFGREVVASHNSHAVMLMMRIIHGFLAKPPKLSNRRVRREVQEVGQKVIDTVMSIANRAFVELSLPVKGEVRFSFGKEGPTGTLSNATSNNSSSNFVRVEEPEQQSKPAAVPFLVTEDEGHFPSLGPVKSVESSPSVSVVDEHLDEADVQWSRRSNSILALQLFTSKLTTFLDNLFEGERDRIPSVVSTIVHQLFFHVRPKEGTAAPADAAHAEACLNVIVAFAQWETLDIKSWRKEIMDYFLYGATFFKIEAKPLKQWGVVVNQIFKDDRSVWLELIRVVTKALGPQNLFTSKADENKARAHTVKKLAFVIYAGAMDQYVDQLPLIQEKLVDAIKTRDYNKTIAKVFLCMRVLLVRVSPQSLRSFWPVILSELMRVYEATPEPELVLAASKFLDLVLVLPYEDFNMFDWMFLSDQIPAVQDEVSTYVPYIDRIAKKSDPTAWLNYKPVRPSPLVTITKVQSSSGIANLIDVGSGHMTWEGFVSWLSQFSSLEYGNRVASLKSMPDQTAIDGILSHDFSSVRAVDKLDVDTFTTLSRSNSGSGLPDSSPKQ